MALNFLHRIKNKLIKPPAQAEDPPLPQTISQRDLVKLLSGIPNWEKKIDIYNQYQYSPRSGAWKRKTYKPAEANRHDESIAKPGKDNSEKIHYGCGGNLIEGWLNVDLYPLEAENYCSVNLLNRHPFPDDSACFGFSEDVLEHLNQAQSIFFLSEIHRTLKKDGVIRLSFPGLEGVLDRHYSPYSETRVRQGEFEAYSFWDHIHFYSKAELKLVAEHIGFRGIKFLEYGKSSYPELCDLDTRTEQIGLNSYVELKK